ncbi:MAG: DUF479 domain-containing protein [Sphingobacteriales bacterium]|nr:DUF479 domain-containing protein [Sphingobacteriales bacterium]
MNYLAHAYLSFNHPPILVGNMINDFVRGKKQYDYPAEIQKGLILHKNIDTFTDAHPVTAHLKSFFRPQYRLYAGAFGDVAYDHFLAKDKNIFPTDKALKNFSQQVYTMLDDNFDLLPERFQKMMPYMKSQDWLSNYGNADGIKNSFAGLARRAAYLTESDIAFELFNQHYNEIQQCYDDFFPALKSFATYQFNQLTSS